AVEEPLRRIVGNAGLEGSIVLQKVEEGQGAFGYNARTDKYEDLTKAGVIDPTKVTRTALQNAASVAGLLLTTEAMIAEKPKKQGRGAKISCCYESGPTGYGLHRDLVAAGFRCAVVAPSLVPKQVGMRVKTDRRDAVKLARFLRSGDLTAVAVPDKATEAM